MFSNQNYQSFEAVATFGDEDVRTKLLVSNTFVFSLDNKIVTMLLHIFKVLCLL